LPAASGRDQRTGNGDRNARIVCGACQRTYAVDDDNLRLAEAP